MSAPIEGLSPSLKLIQRPSLPRATALLGYLRQIEDARWYSNRGQLSVDLEVRLSGLVGGEGHSVLAVSSGTAAIEAAILASAGPGNGALALVPAYTFTATALAVIRCGYVPHFVDVDPDTFMMDPELVATHPALSRVGLILPVAALGRAPDMAAWDRVAAATGLPVVIDAAASIEHFFRGTVQPSRRVPVALSFHATKSFSTAEGGAVVWNDPEGLVRCAQAVNFGMLGSRESRTDGFNGKLSEYHAAIGLAFLDEWEERSAAYAYVANAYRTAAGRFEVPGQLLTAPLLSSAYVALECDTAESAHLAEQRLVRRGIAARRWYGGGLHDHARFADCPKDPLPVTEDLAVRHLGLPAAPDLDLASACTVLSVISGASRELSGYGGRGTAEWTDRDMTSDSHRTRVGGL